MASFNKPPIPFYWLMINLRLNIQLRCVFLQDWYRTKLLNFGSCCRQIVCVTVIWSTRLKAHFIFKQPSSWFYGYIVPPVKEQRPTCCLSLQPITGLEGINRSNSMFSFKQHFTFCRDESLTAVLLTLNKLHPYYFISHPVPFNLFNLVLWACKLYVDCSNWHVVFQLIVPFSIVRKRGKKIV